MTTMVWLKESMSKLSEAGVATARLDSLVLLEDFIGKDRSWLLANPEFKIDDAALLNAQVERRAKHEPLAYIRGKSEFYGREFIVNEHTLEPRPETETMIGLLKELLTKDKDIVIVDIGTGSGCIAITAKLEHPQADVWGIDIDNKCIETATENAKRLKADVNFCTANLLDDYEKGMSGRTQNAIVCANLPYVPDKYQLNEAAKFEPKHAIFGGEDGLDLYRQLFLQLKNVYILRYSAEYRHRPKYVLTESLPFQHETVAEIAQEAGYKLEKTDDFVQVFELGSS